jgi:hypothetical protein
MLSDELSGLPHSATNIYNATVVQFECPHWLSAVVLAETVKRKRRKICPS